MAARERLDITADITLRPGQAGARGTLIDGNFANLVPATWGDVEPIRTCARSMGPTPKQLDCVVKYCRYANVPFVVSYCLRWTLQNFIHEVEIWAGIKPHPNILPLLGCYINLADWQFGLVSLPVTPGDVFQLERHDIPYQQIYRMVSFLLDE
jgi:hypothetical protein